MELTEEMAKMLGSVTKYEIEIKCRNFGTQKKEPEWNETKELK